MTFSLALVALVFTGCAGRASPEECRKACERVVEFRTATVTKQAQMALHERLGMLEAHEKQAKSNLTRLREELAIGTAAFDEAPLRAHGLPAKDIQAARERHTWEAAELRRQRESGIRASEEALVEEKKAFEAAQKASGAEVAKATEAERAACTSSCEKKSRSYATCLLRTQAIEDVAACDAG